MKLKLVLLLGIGGTVGLAMLAALTNVLLLEQSQNNFAEYQLLVDDLLLVSDTVRVASELARYVERQASDLIGDGGESGEARRQREQEISRRLAQLDVLRSRVDREITYEERQEAKDRMLAALSAMVTGIEEVLLVSGNGADAATQLGDDLERLSVSATEVSEIGTVLLESVDVSTELEQERVTSLNRTASSISRVFAVIVILEGLLVTWALLRTTLRRLGADPVELRHAAGLVAAGDLRDLAIVVRDGRDTVARSINRIREAQRDRVHQMRDISVSAVRMAEQARADVETSQQASHAIARAIRAMNSEVENIRSLVSESREHIRSIADRVAQLDEQTSTQSSATFQATAAVEQIIANIESVRKVMEARTDVAQRLAESASSGREAAGEVDAEVQGIVALAAQIGDATQAINEIASQTDLLSMNAAIEAAQAGEYGRGFAVVAEEIRKLSETAGENARRVGDLLSAISQRVSTASDLTHRNQDRFEQVAESAESVERAFSEVLASATELSAGGTEILTAMSDLRESATTVRASSEAFRVASSEAVEDMDQIDEATVGLEQRLAGVQQSNTELTGRIDNTLESSRRLNDTANRIEQAFEVYVL